MLRCWRARIAVRQFYARGAKRSFKCKVKTYTDLLPLAGTMLAQAAWRTVRVASGGTMAMQRACHALGAAAAPAVRAHARAYLATSASASTMASAGSGSSCKRKRVLVTGGANGIGRGIVDHFLGLGDRVAYADLVPRGDGATLGFEQPPTAQDSNAAATAGHGHGHGHGEPFFLQCDCSSAEQVEAAVAAAMTEMGVRPSLGSGHTHTHTHTHTRTHARARAHTPRKREGWVGDTVRLTADGLWCTCVGLCRVLAPSPAGGAQGLDVLVNNVGAHFEAGVPCHELSVEAWDTSQRVNLRSHFLFTKFVLRDAMVPQRHGAIVRRRCQSSARTHAVHMPACFKVLTSLAGHEPLAPNCRSGLRRSTGTKRTASTEHAVGCCACHTARHERSTLVRSTASRTGPASRATRRPRAPSSR